MVRVDVAVVEDGGEKRRVIDYQLVLFIGLETTDLVKKNQPKNRAESVWYSRLNLGTSRLSHLSVTISPFQEMS